MQKINFQALPEWCLTRLPFSYQTRLMPFYRNQKISVPAPYLPIKIDIFDKFPLKNYLTAPEHNISYFVATAKCSEKLLLSLIFLYAINTLIHLSVFNVFFYHFKYLFVYYYILFVFNPCRIMTSILFQQKFSLVIDNIFP